MNRILNIQELIDSDRYIIPIYQREFAWTASELYCFVDDIDNARKKGMNEYYIGTMVVFAKNDGSFEVVDGQQRLTALSLLLYLDSNKDNIKLRYEARPSSEKALENLRNGGEYSYSEHIFYSSIRLLRQRLEDIDDIDAFFSYLRRSVYLIRFELSKDTDLNHYFEIMNSRQKQCEETDLLKAYLLSFLDNGKEREVFNIVWAGLSRFDIFMQEAIPERLWNRMCYGDGWAPLLDVDYALWWKMISSHVEGDSDSFVGSLDSVLLYDGEENIRARIKESSSSCHMSIVSFSQFISICNSLILGIDYDYKEFLDNVKSKGIFNSPDDVKSYINSLLIYRYLFDTYIIKRSPSSWTLSKYVDVNEFTPTFGDDNKQLVALQSLYASSLDSEWIALSLKHLYTNRHEDSMSFISFLKSLMEEFKGRRYELYRKLYLENGDVLEPYMAIEDGKLVRI